MVLLPRHCYLAVPLLVATIFFVEELLLFGREPLPEASQPAIAARLAAQPRSRGRNTMLTRMPGKSYSGPLPPLTAQQTGLRSALKEDIEKLAGQIGERNLLRHARLTTTAAFIENSFQAFGYLTSRHAYEAKGRTCYNVEAEIRGTQRPDEIVLVGAHYDTVSGCPGANDNSSGVAALLALARAAAKQQSSRTLRFVAFANEEAPYFHTELMGSWVYAGRCKQRGEKIVAMLCLETIGYYSDAPNSQHYPPPFNAYYPSTGNFIGFVGNVQSADLVSQVVEIFRRHTQFPSEGGALPAEVPGVGWSDHWAFWQYGYPAVMATDTAPFRYPHYHLASDTPDKLDYDRMARVVWGIQKVVEELAGVLSPDSTRAASSTPKADHDQ